jgi:hypothetical protein
VERATEQSKTEKNRDSRSRYQAPNAKQVAHVQRRPSRQQKKDDVAACLRFLNYLWPSFGRQPIGLFPYFPEL